MPSINALLRTLGVAVALQITVCVPAWACDGQVGKVIFEDNFADNLGGWGDEAPTISIKPPELLIKLDKNGTQIRAIRAQVPAGKLRSGIFGELLDNSKAVDNSPPIRVKSFKLTAGE